MKVLHLVDLLHHRLVKLPAPEGEEEFSVHEKILLSHKQSSQIVAKVLKRPHEEPWTDKGDDEYSFSRKLTLQDLKDYETLVSSEKPRVIAAKKCAEKLDLSMRFFASRTDLTGKTFSFFFTSEEPVDFRDLLKLLGKEFGRTRIHLERVGARDRAKIVGGFGICGQETCCSSFKMDLGSIPMNAARDQNLKIKDNDQLLGLCGKLKCCLVYELKEYRRMRKYLPHLRQTVTTAKGKMGRVIGLDILNKKVKVLMENDIPEVCHVDDLKWGN